MYSYENYSVNPSLDINLLYYTCPTTSSKCILLNESTFTHVYCNVHTFVEQVTI